MKVPGNAILAGLGLLPPRPPAAGARQVNTSAGTKANAAGQTSAGAQAGAARKSIPTAGDKPAGPAQARNLEQAVQALADQGRLPPRGSLIDLRA